MINLILDLKPGESLEIFLLAVIFFFQCYATYSIVIEIYKFKRIFKLKSSVQLIEGSELGPILNYSGKNKVMADIIFTINNYLYKNQGGVVDFHILKDIVDRNVDNDEDEISNKISTPLYLGLAGTMIGIVLGLWYIDLSPVLPSAIGNVSSNNSILDISPLIDGVKWAMSVSVIGLVLTTTLSVVFFRKARAIVNEGRNNFLSILQTDLLPSLVRSEDAAIQELSQRLNHFSINTPDYIKSLSSNTNDIKQSIETELNILKEIKQLDVKKMSASNVEIFYSLSGMMDQFAAFPKYYEELNSSLGNTISLNKNLQKLVSRTEDVNLILRDVKDIIESGSEATTFFNAHIQSFEKYSEAVNNSVATADQKLEEAMLQLGDAVKNQFDVFSLAITEYDIKLTKSFDNSIKLFNETYTNSVPKFEKLNHLSGIENKLKNLESIENKIDNLKSIPSSLSTLQSILEKQNKLLTDFNISLPSDLNLNLKKGNRVYYIVRDSVFILASISIITYVILQILPTLN